MQLQPRALFKLTLGEEKEQFIKCLHFVACCFLFVFVFFKGFFLARCGCVLVPAHDRSGFAVLTHTILHLPKSKLWPELSYKDEFLIGFRISLSLGAQYWERKNSNTPPLFQQHFFTLSSVKSRRVNLDHRSRSNSCLHFLPCTC